MAIIVKRQQPNGGDQNSRRRIHPLRPALQVGAANSQTTAQPEAAPERKFMAPGIEKPDAESSHRC